MAISKLLKKYAAADNIVPLILEQEMGDSDLAMIGQKCLQGLEEDKRSMKDWLTMADQAMDLAGLKAETKNYPFTNAANIKFPLITTSVLQYTSRTLGEMIKDGKVCNYKVIGRDPQFLKARRGDRRSIHMNRQLMEVIPHWMDYNEKLLQQWAVVGCGFKMTWYDPCIKGPRSEMVPYDQLILNYNETNLDDCPRVTRYVYQSKNKLVEYQRYGFYDNMDDVENLTMDADTTDTTNFELIEQHCWIDLDDDGYEEPYIVTIHVASGKVFRIVSRFEERDIELNSDGEIQKINAMNYFTLFTFLPSLDGSIFGTGMGTLLAPLNKATNTSINVLLNSGHLSTMQGGFIGKSLKINKKDLMIDPGQWIPATAADGSSLKDNIVPLNYKEPSQVLLQLVQYLVEAAKTLSASTDVMTGTSDTTNVSPNTLMSLIQQSLTTYVPIQRRFFRGLKDELRKLAALNQRYLDIVEYVDLIDPSPEEFKEMFDEQGNLVDYDLKMVDVVPVVDVNESTKQESIMKAQALNAFIQPFLPSGTINIANVVAFTCRSMEIEPDIYQTFINPPQQPPPDPKLLEIKRKSDRDQQEMAIKAAEVKSKSFHTEAQVDQTKANTVKTMADIKHQDDQTKLQGIDMAMSDDQFNKELDLKDRALKVSLAQSAMKMTTDTHANHIKARIGEVKEAPPEEDPNSPIEGLTADMVDQEAQRRGWVKNHPHVASKDHVIRAALAKGYTIKNQPQAIAKHHAIALAQQRGFNIKGGTE